MKYSIFLLSLSVLFCNCRPSAEEKRPGSDYVVKTFRLESSGGCSADTMHCAYYEVNYPEFTGLDSAVLAELRRRIDATVSMGNPEVEGQTMKQIGEAFIKDFEDFNKNMPQASGGWHYSAMVKVEVLTDTLLSLSIRETYYTGGAHGGHGTFFISIAPKTGASVTLDNFLKIGYLEPLTQLGEKAFRQVRAIPDTASLEDSGFEFPDDSFQLNKNYGFKNEGIVFCYNSYEIASYASGPTEILIPYDALADWIK